MAVCSAFLATASGTSGQLQKQPASTLGSAESSERNAREGYPRDIPLGDAVADFNVRAGADAVGRLQPPLTADEIVAAIRAWEGPPPGLPASVKDVYQSIARKAVMPKGSFIRFIPGLIAVHGFDIDVWWIDVQVALDRYPTDLKDVPQYAYRVRTSFVRSRVYRKLM